jgi:hypothetical protein
MFAELSVLPDFPKSLLKCSRTSEVDMVEVEQAKSDFLEAVKLEEGDPGSADGPREDFFPTALTTPFLECVHVPLVVVCPCFLSTGESWSTFAIRVSKVALADVTLISVSFSFLMIPFFDGMAVFDDTFADPFFLCLLLLLDAADTVDLSDTDLELGTLLADLMVVGLTLFPLSFLPFDIVLPICLTLLEVGCSQPYIST